VVNFLQSGGKHHTFHFVLCVLEFLDSKAAWALTIALWLEKLLFFFLFFVLISLTTSLRWDVQPWDWAAGKN
jgi:hypothetical protein